jgi:hypothetical protein
VIKKGIKWFGHVRHMTEMTKTFWWEDLKGRHHLEYVCIERIILKQNLEK